MESMNLHASFQNLTQADRLQQDIHRNPVVNHQQNAAIAQEDRAQRAEAPVQTDQTENRTTDPNDKKRVFLTKRVRKKVSEKNRRTRSLDGGLFIDCDA
jgi:hypothetical protein